MWQKHSVYFAKIIKEGFVPQWNPCPPRIDRGDSINACRSQEEIEKMDAQVESLLKQEVIKPVKEEERESPYVISTFFGIPKPDGRMRGVINLKTINPYIPTTHFKMENLKTLKSLIRQRDYLIKIDLRDAFWHLAIHPKHRRYFRFRWRKQILEWQVMPFGYKDAPRLFTSMMKVITKVLRGLGIRLVIYMDDLLIMAESATQALNHRDIVIRVLTQFGMTINWEKSVLIPSQRVNFLGVIVDSIKMCLELPPEKLENVKLKVKALLTLGTKGRPPRLIDLQSIVGTLQSTADCILPTRLHLNNLISDLRQAEKGPAPLSPGSIEDLEWWLESMPLWNGKSILTPMPSHVLDTDASETAWGATCIDSTTYVRMESKGSFVDVMTSNLRELTAIMYGVQTFARSANWHDCVVLVRTDNQVAMSYTNRMGGREPHLSAVAEQLHKFALSRRILVKAEWIPGIENTVADRLSREETDWSDAMLHPDLFRMIDTMWGPHTLDGAAAMWNRQLPRYVSWTLDPECLYTDLMSRPFPAQDNIYLNVPFAMIAPVLQKVRAEKATVTLVIPLWNQQSWWPILWELLADWPLVLPSHSMPLLKYSMGRQQGYVPPWSLAAVRLSATPSKSLDFRKTLSKCTGHATRLTNMALNCIRMTAISERGKLGAFKQADIALLSTSVMWLSTQPTC